MLFVLYPLSCIFIPAILLQIFFCCFKKRRPPYLALHIVWVYIFLFYLYLVLEVTGIGTIWDIGKFGSVIRPEEINLVPFAGSGFMTCFLNAFMFMPLGFLLPLIWKKYRNLTNVVLLSCVYSLAIEVCQLFNRRQSDITDLLMNTLGGALGFFLWKLFSVFLQKWRKKFPRSSKGAASRAVSLDRFEAALYTGFSILSQFLFFNWRWLI